MSDKFKITGDEINQILMHSPYALSNSLNGSGLGADEIRKYFYDFITVLVKKLNIHLGEVEVGDEELIQLINQASEAWAQKFNAHDVGETVHMDIRNLIAELKGELAKQTKTLTETSKKARDAYDLALGKPKVHVVSSFYIMVADLISTGAYPGDIYLILEKNTPDFIVLSNKKEEGAVELTRESLNSLPTPSVGAVYYIEGISVAGIESGIDTSAFATKGELADYVTDEELAELLKDNAGEKYEEIVTFTTTESSDISFNFEREYKKVIVRVVNKNAELPKFTLLDKNSNHAVFYGVNDNGSYEYLKAMYIGEILPAGLALNTCYTGGGGNSPKVCYSVTNRFFDITAYVGVVSVGACPAGTEIKVYGVRMNEN